MSIPKFPLDPDQIVGRFWVAGAEPGQHSDGVCRVRGSAIEVEVAKPLTSWMTQLDESTLGIQVPAQEDEAWVVQGNLPISPGAVTFLGVRTAARRSNFFPSSHDVPELHRVRADWCIAGAHVNGMSALFTGIRARFTHLELWAQTSGLEMVQQVQPQLKSTYSFVPPEPETAAFDGFEQTAQLKLQVVATLGMPNAWGSQITTSNWLELDGLDGWTLEESLARFVVPVEALLTGLAGEKCSATHLEVKVGDKWCPVYGASVQADAQRPDEEPLLLGRSALSLDLLSPWCELVAELSPAPHIIASSTAGIFSTLPSEASALTTTAEGMDRALYPDSRRFTEEEVATSVAELKDSSVPQPVRQALIDALVLYFYEDSYPTRMKRLATVVSAAAPGCVGKPNKWASEMTKMRVGLAHALGTQADSDDDALWLMHARVQSLRWALFVRVLLEAGVAATSVTEALNRSERYRRDERRWQNLMPKVFSPDN